MGMISEFKEFAMRGNVVDLAVGVIIGGAFGKIVTALVDGIVMPPIGLMLGGVNFRDLAYQLKPAVVDAAGKTTSPAVAIQYGAFTQTIIDFLIVAFVIFVMVKLMNKLKRKEVPPPAPPAPPSDEVRLLTEIRDALRSR
jgi:large conductance mechanosensitive channel